MSLQVRRFVSEDRPGLVQAINAVCGEGRWMSTTRFEPTPAWIHALQEPECPYHLLLVVEDGEEIVGWCRTFPKDGSNEAKEVLLGIGLLPAYRDRGLGTDLIRRSLAWARDAGYRRVSLTTRPDNTRAIHVFQRCDFAFTGKTHGQMLKMTCTLAKRTVNAECISEENPL